MFGILMLIIAAILTSMAGWAFYQLLRERPREETLSYKQNRRLQNKMAATGYGSLLIIGGSIPPVDGWDPGLVFMLLVAFHFLASWRIVSTKELGAVLFFNKPLYPVEHGLRFVLWLVCSLSKETRLTIEDEIPADPEKIYRGKRDEPEVVPENLLKEGFRPPIRVTFLAVAKEKKVTGEGEETVDDPLEERITAETPIIVRWRIVDYIRFLTTIGGRDEAARQMQDMAVAVLADIFPKLTVADAIRTKGDVDKTLNTQLATTTESWGIKIENAVVKSINLSHELNLELQKIAEARAKKRRDKLEGEGAGAKEQATLAGRTAGLKKMQDDLGISSHAVLAAETARAITSNPGQKTVIVGAAGFQELLGVVAAAGETLKTVKDEKGGVA